MNARDKVKSIDWAKYYRAANGDMKHMFTRIFKDPNDRYWKINASGNRIFKMADTPRKEVYPYEATVFYNFFGRTYTATSTVNEHRATDYILVEVLETNFDIDVIKNYEKIVSEELATVNWAEAKANNKLTETFEDICGQYIWDDLRDHKEYTIEHNGKSQKLSFTTAPISKTDFITDFLDKLLNTDIEEEAQKIIKKQKADEAKKEAKKEEEENRKLEELSKHLGTPFFSKAKRYIETLPKKDVLELMIKYPQFRESITSAIAQGMPNSEYADYLIENNGDKLWKLWSAEDHYSTFFIKNISEFALLENMSQKDMEELRKSFNKCCEKLKLAQEQITQQKTLEDLRNSEKFAIIEKDLSDKDHIQFILENEKGEKFKLNIDYADENYIDHFNQQDKENTSVKYLCVKYEKIDSDERYSHRASLPLEVYNKAPQALDKLFLSNLKTLIRDRAFHSYYNIPYKAIRLQSLLRSAITKEGVRKKQIRIPIEKNR